MIRLQVPKAPKILKGNKQCFGKFYAITCVEDSSVNSIMGVNESGEAINLMYLLSNKKIKKGFYIFIPKNTIIRYVHLEYGIIELHHL